MTVAYELHYYYTKIDRYPTSGGTDHVVTNALSSAPTGQLMFRSTRSSHWGLLERISIPLGNWISFNMLIDWDVSVGISLRENGFTPLMGPHISGTKTNEKRTNQIRLWRKITRQVIICKQRKSIMWWRFIEQLTSLLYAVVVIFIDTVLIISWVWVLHDKITEYSG